MIHMLSRFDLKPSAALDDFAADYAQAFDDMRALGLAEATSPVGRRIPDTQMDTDAADAREYYATMTFRDREQLDAAYQRLIATRKDPAFAAHWRVTRAILRPVFTVWEDHGAG